jgi:hypothetical protein
LEVLFATLEKLRITEAWDWKCAPIEITHSDVGGCSDIKRTIHAFVRRYAWLVDVKVTKKGPRMVSYFCKDHIFGTSVAKEASIRTFIPQVHSNSLGVYPGDGLYPASLTKPPQFLLRLCRTYTGWCKRKLDADELLSLYDISDTVALFFTQEQSSKVIGVHHLTPVNIILSAALAVIKEVPGGGGFDLIPDRRVKVRQEEELEMNQFENQGGKSENLGLKGKPLTAQEEEATKDDDATIPYHFWNYRLTRLWDSDILPPSIKNPAEVIR